MTIPRRAAYNYPRLGSMTQGCARRAKAREARNPGGRAESYPPAAAPGAAAKRGAMKKSIGARATVFPAPVFVVGTYDAAGKPNVMTVAWAGVCCSEPPCISIALREATYTYGNLLERKAFTLSIPSEKYIREADYFGLVSGRTVDKLAVAGLKAAKSTLVDAPYVEEFPFVMECCLIKTVKLGLHTLFIGEIQDVKMDEAVQRPNGMPDIEKVKPAIFNPVTQSYFGLGKPLGEAFSIGKDIKETAAKTS